MSEHERTFIYIDPIAEYEKPKPDDVLAEGEFKYEVFEPESLRLDDIGRNDRAFVSTKSGTEFMVRYSERHGGYKIYSRSYDLIKGAKLMDAPNSSSLLVDKNASMRFVVENVEDNTEPYKVWHTSPVEEIKIIKNIDNDVNEHKVLTIGALK